MTVPADIEIINADNARLAIHAPLAPGRAIAAESRPVALSTEDIAALTLLHTDLTTLLPAALGGNGGLKTTSPDVRPVSGTITAQDVASSTASGQNSVSIITGAATASSTHAQAINGMSTARVEISGTWTGTLAFEGSADGGTTWIAQSARVTGTAYTQGSVTGNGLFSLDVAGLTNFRVRSTAAMTGTATVQTAFAAAPGFVQITNPVTFAGPTAAARLPSSAASTNATNVKTTAGRIFQLSGKNNAAYDIFLVLYDSAANPPVPGTTTIRKKVVCPAGQAFVYDIPGAVYANGIGYAFTKLVADADTTAIAATDITAFNLDYA